MAKVSVPVALTDEQVKAILEEDDAQQRIDDFFTRHNAWSKVVNRPPVTRRRKRST